MNSNSSRARYLDLRTQEDSSNEKHRRDDAQELAVTDSAAELREEVAARLAAHRARRSRLVPTSFPDPVRPAPDLTAPIRPANPIAAAVVARYANSPSYRSLLAEEAERATRQAAAAAEIAARNAAAIAEVQRQLLAELDLAEAAQAQAEAEAFAEAQAKPQAQAQAQAQAKAQASTEAQAKPQPAIVHATQNQAIPAPAPFPAPALIQTSNQAQPEPYDLEEARALDDEIDFRRSPIFDPPAGPNIPLPANLLEFPRQLQAPRKARPIRALGPLADVQEEDQQLRIFEVAPEQTIPEPEFTSTMPAWASIWLDSPAPPAATVETVEPISDFTLDLTPALSYELDALNNLHLDESPAAAEDPFPLLHLPQRATLPRRAMAFAVDATVVGLGFLAAVTTFAVISTTLPRGAIAAIAAAAILSGIAIIFQILFFTFSDHTPGMVYARIALCTFEGERPTRRALKARLLLVVLGLLPLGLGLWWALFDKDRLGWHDRISRIYQREY